MFGLVYIQCPSRGIIWKTNMAYDVLFNEVNDNNIARHNQLPQYATLMIIAIYSYFNIFRPWLTLLGKSMVWTIKRL